MPNRELKLGIRGVLGQYGITREDIEVQLVEITEVRVGWRWQQQVFAIAMNPDQFSHRLQIMLEGLGAMWLWHGPVYDLTPLNLTQNVRTVATEDLSAIRRFSQLPGFDAVKALTSVFRILKAIQIAGG